MIAFWVGIGFIAIGVAVAAWSVWRVSALAVDGPAEHAGPYVYPFVYGCGLAIVGACVIAGQLLLRNL